MDRDEPDVGLPRPQKAENTSTTGDVQQLEALQGNLEKVLKQSRKGGWARSFLLVCFGCIFGVIGVAGGFMYGDYYGRQHAQYDNPALKEHYAGQCYEQFSKQLMLDTRKAIGSEFEKLGQIARTKNGWVPSGGKQKADSIAQINQASHSLPQQNLEDLQEIKRILTNLQLQQVQGGAGKDASALVKNVQELIRQMKKNQLQLVAEKCPASSRLPKSYSSRSVRGG